MTKDELFQSIPEFMLIKDADMRENAALAMLDAVTAGGWEQKGGVKNCPAFLDENVSACPGGWLNYTRRVAGTAEALFQGIYSWASTKTEIDHDCVIAGALLSGIGKLTEYDLDAEGNPCLSKTGHLFRYPCSGAWFAVERGLPRKVVHIIVSISSRYSPDGNKAAKTPESIVVKQADEMCYGILKAVNAVKAIKR